MENLRQTRTSIKWLLLLATALGALTGCKEALNVESGAKLPSLLEPNNGVPTISSPPSTTYYSNEANLVIQGVCSEGATVNLAGDEIQSTVCSDQQYVFVVFRVQDGSYSFNISQIVAGVNSGAANLLWVKKSSVSNPTVTSPVTNPYFSSENLVAIEGTCETGALIILSGDATGQDVCEASQFSIDVFKFVDGNYNISVTQRDQAGNEADLNFLWNKGQLEVSPNDPQVVATRSQVFTVNGGANSYTVTFLDNQSGGTFDGLTNTYTAGTVAGVTDQLEVRDSQNFTRIVNIEVLAEAPDHFEFGDVDGNDQNTLIGTDLALPIVAKVVDQYGNGVPNYSVLFQKIVGDVEFLDPSLQVTNANGEAYLNLRQGYSSFRSYVSVAPLSGVLPDVVASGDSTLSFQILSNNTNNGNFDLTFDVASGPDNRVVTDVNGDGNQDILILNKGENTISVLAGVGNGLMTPLLKVNGLCAGATSMDVGDFNGDTVNDLILSCSGGGGFYSFMAGNGNGTFQAAVNTVIDGGESFPVDIVSADFNGDTFLDFVMTSAGTAKIAVRTGNNDGTFNAPTLYDTGSSPSKVVVGDVDNLNGLDLVLIDAGDESFSVLLDDGLGGFAPRVSYSTAVAPAAIVLSDFNSNGYLDVVVASNVDNKISVYLNNQDGTFNLGIDTPVGSGPIALHADEISGDAAIDLIVANIGDNTISVLHGFDNGTFDIQAPINTATSPINVGSADFNNDSNQDVLIVSSGEAKVQILPGQTSGELGFLTAVGNNPSKSLSGDFDGDGFRDKLVLNQNSGSISRLKGVNNGLFNSFGADVAIGGAPNDGVVLDLNGDGFLDVVVTDFSTNAIRVLLGVGDGSFGIPSNYPTGLQPSSLVSGDFNMDGNVDIVVTNSGPNSISFFPGNGVGGFGVRIDTLNVGAQPSAIAAADFNNDNRLDIVVANQSAGAIGVLMSNGNGSFQAAAPYSAQAGTNGVVTGFFNADGFIDIAVSNSLASSVTVFIGENGGGFASGVNYFSGFDPVGLVKGDVTGDNREDLVLGNGLNQTATILIGSLAGSFSTSETVNTNVNSVNVELDDINGDGALDLSVLDGTNNKLKILPGH